MANRVYRVAGTEYVLESSGATLSDGSLVELTDETLSEVEVDGSFTAAFEFDAVGSFSVAPTTGNALHVYEQTINSDSNDSPDPQADYGFTHLFSFEFNDSDVAQYLRREGVPINFTGAKYWLMWEDGGAGAASISATWACRLIIEEVRTDAV